MMLRSNKILHLIETHHTETDQEWWDAVRSQVERHGWWKEVTINPTKIPFVEATPHYPDLVEEYEKCESDPPPIVVNEEGFPIDGAHRLMVAFKQGKTVYGYVPDWIKEPWVT